VGNNGLIFRVTASNPLQFFFFLMEELLASSDASGPKQKQRKKKTKRKFKRLIEARESKRRTLETKSSIINATAAGLGNSAYEVNGGDACNGSSAGG
jgi:CBS domain containing-hemolysin-like protein